MSKSYTVTDSFEDLTVLYHRGCQQGFKFFGDDPEEHKHTSNKNILIWSMRSYLIGWTYQLSSSTFYMHSRCLLFNDGIWMSETAKHPHFLRYKPRH